MKGTDEMMAPESTHTLLSGDFYDVYPFLMSPHDSTYYYR